MCMKWYCWRSFLVSLSTTSSSVIVQSRIGMPYVIVGTAYMLMALMEFWLFSSLFNIIFTRLKYSILMAFFVLLSVVSHSLKPRYRYCCPFSKLFRFSPQFSVMSFWRLETFPRMIVILLHLFIPNDILMSSLNVLTILMRLWSWLSLDAKSKRCEMDLIDIVSHPCLRD